MKTKFKKKLAGLTVVELILDLVLSTLVVSAVLGLYVNYKTSYNYQSDTMYIYQNARTAYNYIHDDMQVAGFYGCNSNAGDIEYKLTPGFDYLLNNIVTGFEATGTGINSTFSLASPSAGWTPVLQGQMATRTPDAGSDVITVRFSDTNSSGILSADTTGASLSSTGIQNNVAVGDILLISDCQRTVLFQVATVGTNTITPTLSVGSLNSGAEIYRINVHSYYIKTVNGVPGLYRVRNNVDELVVPYVQNMQLFFGQDTNSDGITDRYNTANNVGSNPITNLTLSFLLRSINKHTQSQLETSFKILNAPTAMQTTTTITTSSDKYLRKSFDFNLNLPNVGGVL